MELSLILFLIFLGIAFVYRDITNIFFLFFLLSLGFFLPQIDLLLTRETEEDFTPRESQRVVPLIETTEALGGILSGGILSLLVGKIHIESFLFVIGGIFFFLLILSAMVHQMKVKVYRLGEKREHLSLTSLATIRRGIQHIRAVPYMRGIALLLFLWVITLNIVDIQYTRSLETMHSIQESEHVLDQSPLKDILAERLGFFQILFSILAFLMQMFVTGRILNTLGIVRSFLLLPLITTLFALGGIMVPGMLFPVLAKASMEMLGGVQKTAYHSSYYSILEHMREYIRELLEGILKPFGLITATLLVFMVQFLLPSSLHNTGLYMVEVFLFLMMLSVVFSMQKSFTMTAKKNLEMFSDYELTSNAIEILSQPGHHDASEILSKALLYRTHGPDHKIKILQALGRLQDPQALPEILACLKDDHLEIKIEACRALAQYQDLGERLNNKVFSKYHIITTLSELFIKEGSKRLRSSIIKVLSNIHHHEIVHFLLDILQHSQDHEIIADSIYVIGLFADINCYPYIAPYLTSSVPHIKANAIIALWQFTKYRLPLLIHLLSLLESKDKEHMLSGIYAVGETKAIQEIPHLEHSLLSSDQDIVQSTAVALLKMNQNNAIPPLLSLLFNPDEHIAYQTYNMIQEVQTDAAKLLKKVLKIEGGETIHHFVHIHELTGIPSQQIETNHLLQLLRYYVIMEEDREVMRIKQWLYNRSEQKGVALEQTDMV